MLRLSPSFARKRQAYIKVSKRQNLLRRKQTWYARYFVPKEHQSAFGRAEVQRTLKTRDLVEAKRRLPATIAQIQWEIEEALTNRGLPDLGNKSDVLRELAAIEARIRRGEYEEPEDPAVVHPADLQVDLIIGEHSARLGALDGETGLSEELSSEVLESAALVRQTLHDPNFRPLAEWLEAFITNLRNKGVKDGTWKTHERRLEHFVRWAGSKRDPRLLQDRDAVDYRDYLNSSADLSTRVRKDTATSVRAFFEWLRKDRKVIRYNPFEDLRETVLPNPGDKLTPNRRAWHAEELATMIERLNPARPLWAIFVIALYSGLRINEICSMKLEHFANDCLRVAPEFAKNTNSVRVVPVHPVIAPVVTTLVETSFDGFLISGLVPGGQDKRRGAYPSKRFSEIRKVLGLDSPDTTFHSTRHNFATAAERAGIPVPTFQKLLGHQRQGITLDRYSDGPQLAAMRREVAKITHDRAESVDHPAVNVDQLVTVRIDQFAGNAAWRQKFGRDVLSSLSARKQGEK